MQLHGVRLFAQTIPLSCLSLQTNRVANVASASSKGANGFSMLKSSILFRASSYSLLVQRSFHSSMYFSSSSSRRVSGVSGVSSIWNSSSPDEVHSRSKEDQVDILQWVPGKYEYLDVHLPTPPPLSSHAYVDDQLARLSAAEKERHLLRRAIEERHRLYFAESQRRLAEDPYEDYKNWFDGEEVPRFDLWRLSGYGLKIIFYGSLVSLTLYFFLLPIGKLFDIPLPNPALAMFLRAWHSANAAVQRTIENQTAIIAGRIVPQYEQLWLDNVAEKVIFKMKNPGAPLPLPDKLFIFPLVLPVKFASNKQQIQNTLQQLTQVTHAQH